MATSLFQLFGSVMVDNTEANKSLAKTDEKAGNLAQTFSKGAKTVAKAGAAIGAAAIGAAAGISNMAKESSTTLDVIDKASQRMDISAESYQELAHVANLSGVSMETLERAAKGLEGTGMTIEDAFEQIYALGTAEERSAKAAELLGERVAYQLSPMLNSSAEDMAAMKQEAHDLGLVFSQDTVTAGATLNDTLGNLSDSFNAMKTGLGNALMPVVQKFADLLLKFLPRVQTLFDKIGPVLAATLDAIMPHVINLVDQLLPILAEILDTVMPIFSDICETVLPIIADLLGKLMPIIKELFERLGPIIQGVLDAIKPVLDALWPIISTILDLVVDLLEPIMTLLETLLKPLSALLSPLAKLLEPLAPALKLIGDVLSPIIELLNLVLEPILEFVNWIFGGIADGLNGVSEGLGDENGEGVAGGLSTVAEFVIGPFADAFDTLGSLLGAATDVIGAVFSGIVEFIKDPKQALSDFFGWIEERVQGAKNLLDSLKDIEEANERTEEAQNNMKNRQQAILDAGGDAADRLRRQMMEAGYAGWDMSTTKVPGLAEGAVLEPNRPFLAMLGDQTSGTNIEAPLDTIKQAVSEVIGGLVVNVVVDEKLDADSVLTIVAKQSWIEHNRKNMQIVG